MALVQLGWPVALPGPSMSVLKAAERRRVSSLVEGLQQVAGRQRDFSGEEEVQWEFTAEQALVFDDFWKDGLKFGGSWFVSTWPSAHTEDVAVRRFKTSPKWSLIGHEYWRVSATLDVRGRGVAPMYTPGLVAAFDFQTGFVDLVRPSRGLTIAGGFVADTVNFVNGTQSARLSTTDYFGLPASADFGFGTGDFGIEFHYYLPNPPGGQSIDMVGLNEKFNLYWNGGASLQNQPLSSVASNSVPSGDSNVFTHCFFGRQAGRMYHSKNGVFGGTPNYFGPVPDTAYNVGATAFIAFGNRTLGGPFFSGTWSVDRIRVYKGLCPYTSNFTPETGAYPL